MADKQPTAPERVPTLNGRPVPLKDLNTSIPTVMENAEQGPLKRLVSAYRKLNLIMAGMYTGVGCSGVPHSHHTYTRKTPNNKTTSPDHK